ncbi:MAG: lmo0937 family membrane protein [Dehalococcoidia bacterium]|nr:lmo0937 family membrane protein [Dehalococcoidia bacterium]
MSILWALAVILVIMWILGLSIKIGGRLIHLLIVLAVIVLLYNLFVRS